jgi:spore photoproduct lyase
VSCGYTVINLHLNCPLDCAYCILQGYLANPVLTVHVNLGDLWAELDAALASARSRRALRYGTGELGDSLALDPLTGCADELMAYFRARPPAVLELKTKTTNIESILRAGPAENIVVSWSLNSSRAAEADEKDAPLVADRLAAAAKVQGHGWRVGFHFDPLVRYAGWQEDYSRVIHGLFRAVDPARVAWISLGSLRFPAGLKPLIQKRFPETRLFFEELVRGMDGKLRYFRPLRTELYRFVLDEILRTAGRPVPVYLCMESVEVWGDVFKKNPGGKAALAGFLSSRP